LRGVDIVDRDDHGAVRRDDVDRVVIGGGGGDLGLGARLQAEVDAGGAASDLDSVRMGKRAGVGDDDARLEDDGQVRDETRGRIVVDSVGIGIAGRSAGDGASAGRG
jgi:hypothetical protein